MISYSTLICLELKLYEFPIWEGPVLGIIVHNYCIMGSNESPEHIIMLLISIAIALILVVLYKPF